MGACSAELFNRSEERWKKAYVFFKKIKLMWIKVIGRREWPKELATTSTMSIAYTAWTPSTVSQTVFGDRCKPLCSKTHWIFFILFFFSSSSSSPSSLSVFRFVKWFLTTEALACRQYYHFKCVNRFFLLSVETVSQVYGTSALN